MSDPVTVTGGTMDDPMRQLRSSTDLESIVLDDWQRALARCAEEARAAHTDVGGAPDTAQTWLAERLIHWQTVVRHCQEEVDELTRARERYQSSPPAGRANAERALREAQIRLRAAHEELAHLGQWAHAIAQAARVDDGGTWPRLAPASW